MFSLHIHVRITDVHRSHLYSNHQSTIIHVLSRCLDMAKIQWHSGLFLGEPCLGVRYTSGTWLELLIARNEECINKFIFVVGFHPPNS